MPQLPVALLRCPVCSGDLSLREGTTPDALVCGAGHRFDAARQGYFNLLTGRGTEFEADTAEMVQARVDFLAAGHYAPLADAVGGMVGRAVPDAAALLDAGAGTGYYLGRLQARFPAAAAVAMDISKFALRRAAKTLPGTACLVWDVWRDLPLKDRCIDVVLNVFAPRNASQFSRVLRSGGVLAVVVPRPGHLGEIADAASLLSIAKGKEENLQRSLADGFVLQDRQDLEVHLDLGRQDIRNAALMGPAARHLDRSRLEQTLPPEGSVTPVTARFSISLFSRR
jgi:23S rRNA (guanine745-N1)-methyltransferase